MILLRSRLLVLCGGVLALVAGGLATSCGEAGNRDGLPRPTSPTSRASSSIPAPTPTPISTPTPITSGEYQAALSALDSALAPQFSAVFLSGTPAALSNAFKSAAAELRTQGLTLSRIRPPADVAAAHKNLVVALSTLTSDLSSLAGDARDHTLCTGGAGMPRAASGDGARALRSAATAIASADPAQSYKVGTFMPAAQPDLNRQPANGNLSPGKRGGLGKLTIKAATTDAVIKLTGGGTLIRNIYVRAGQTVVADGIPDGTFDVFFTTGTDWESAASRFTRDCAFSKFDQPLPYQTKYFSTQTQYTTFTLTLYKSIDGNASTSSVDPDSFPAV
ncbi:hypothetical protein [Frankia sp. Cr2]|uniref:hypothetical protein n=1 Tax=Frankia sp. Cr2 TaxID=3073932 RepID=UPI002AD38D07|nr:hypothetical protein [Frankia sp. Cr2]